MKGIKTKKEIELLKKSAKIANSCLKLIEKSLKEKITEKELACRVKEKIKSQGATLAFKTLVACGKRSSKIHPKPEATNRVISGIGYVDFGACYKGYRSDITVPFIKGRIGKKEKKVVEAVLKSYDLAVNSVKIGLPCWKLHEKVDRFLRRNGFKLFHSLGHGLGLKVHDSPIIGKPKKRRLTKKKRLRWKKLKRMTFQDNMVFTLEPAIYARNFGCRLENDVLLTKRGLKQLTHSKLLKI